MARTEDHSTVPDAPDRPAPAPDPGAVPSRWRVIVGSDRWGRKPNLFIFPLGLGVLTFPLTSLIQNSADTNGIDLT